MCAAYLAHALTCECMPSAWSAGQRRLPSARSAALSAAAPCVLDAHRARSAAGAATGSDAAPTARTGRRHAPDAQDVLLALGIHVGRQRGGAGAQRVSLRGTVRIPGDDLCGAAARQLANVEAAVDCRRGAGERP